MRRILIAIAALLAVNVASAQSGVSRTVSWVNADSYTDGTPMPVGTFETVVVINGVERARVPGIQTSETIDDVPWGTSDYWAYHVDSNGVVGLNSSIVMDYVQPVPAPPTNVTVEQVLAALRSACDQPGNPSAFRDVCTLVASL